MTALAEELTPPGFRHEAFLYRGDDEFLAGVTSYVREGLADGDTILVAEPADRLTALRDALGDDLTAYPDVRFLDMAEVGANPGRILGVWATALADAVAAGRRLRGVGEPAYPGRRPPEFDECHLHELLFDAAFARGPAWGLMCPYDVRHLPSAVRHRAVHSHPEWSTVSGRGPTDSDLERLLADAFAAPLPPPPGAALRGTFGPADVPAVRRTVATWARSCRLPAERVEVLEVAASELATNALRHGGGSGTVAMWAEPGAAVLEVADAGRLDDPLVGRLRPRAGQEGGAGIYLLHQLCDLLQVRSGPGGTTVRVSTWR